jgi:hypothetical protein
MWYIWINHHYHRCVMADEAFFLEPFYPGSSGHPTAFPAAPAPEGIKSFPVLGGIGIGRQPLF